MSTQNRAREGLRKKLHRVVDSVVSEWRLCLGAEDVQQNVPGLLRGKAACLAMPEDDQPEEGWEEPTTEFVRPEEAA